MVSRVRKEIFYLTKGGIMKISLGYFSSPVLTVLGFKLLIHAGSAWLFEVAVRTHARASIEVLSLCKVLLNINLSIAQF